MVFERDGALGGGRLSDRDWALLDGMLRRGSVAAPGGPSAPVIRLAGSAAHLAELARAGLIKPLPATPGEVAAFLITDWGEIRWRQEHRRRLRDQLPPRNAA